MGYVSRNIAQITEPKVLTLASSPNFVTFTSYPGVKSYFIYDITINATQATSNLDVVTQLQVYEPTSVVHTFTGTTDITKVGGSTFYVSTDKANTAENLRLALLGNAWIAANFDVQIASSWAGTVPTNGTTLRIKSKGVGADYNITILCPSNGGNVAYTLSAVNTNSLNSDSISGGANTAEIELDVYTDPAVFLGEDDRPTTDAKLGTYAVSLQKTYAGVPLWFELNSAFQRFAGYNAPPTAAGWFDAGTIRAYRFIAKKRGVDSFTFYQSSVLFVVNGYGRASENLDLTAYTYGTGTFKLLSNMPRVTYVRGQRAYLNFIFSDPLRNAPGVDDYALQIAYRVYSASDAYLGTIYGQTRNRLSFSVVNTCVLDIDAVLAAHPKAGIIRVSLARNNVILSNEQVYEVRPDCLHQLTQFSFLNRLGGWDAFNFDASPENEIKPKTDTFNRTVTPSYTKDMGTETVYTSNLESTITVEGAPVTDAVAEWLGELAASRVILDNKGRRIVLEDFKVKPNDTGANMQIPTIKYHLSETFTND